MRISSILLTVKILPSMSKVRILPSIVQAFLFPAILLTSFRSEALRVVRFSKIAVPGPFSSFLALNTRFLDRYVANFTIIGRMTCELSLSGRLGPFSRWDLSTWKISKQMLFLENVQNHSISIFTFFLFNPSYYETVSPRILLSLVHFQLVLRFKFTDLLKQYRFFFLPAVKFIRIKLVWFL